jgi:hypothetical protein
MSEGVTHKQIPQQKILRGRSAVESEIGKGLRSSPPERSTYFTGVRGPTDFYRGVRAMVHFELRLRCD